ncbi:hypothetical protein [Hydrogenophaga sp.]|uniref:hypothetical protein n=1 Tax=Hydrogenophaga sp. TaxID=1904254 RepID=UPI0027176109|nr:hypothetical protein [Hydrogenophaga sp.]MDO9606009.1 hypothetical protein [Hydrogenophaga sp.]
MQTTFDALSVHRSNIGLYLFDGSSHVQRSAGFDRHFGGTTSEAEITILEVETAHHETFKHMSYEILGADFSLRQLH